MRKRVVNVVIHVIKLCRSLLVALLVLTLGNSKQAKGTLLLEQARPCACEDNDQVTDNGTEITANEALLATQIATMNELQQILSFEYFDSTSKAQLGFCFPMVAVSQCSHGRLMVATLDSGIDEDDFRHARDGDFWDQVNFALSTPYTLSQWKHIQQVYNLGRRRRDVFGEGDIAFYDLAEATMFNIVEEDLKRIPSRDTTEKGFINTFNHVTAQALMTSIFSERLADFIADLHERHNMKELITGDFSQEQLTDPINNPVENYVDLINNEWGQELGKRLKVKYDISEQTLWSPELLANYLNDLQEYYSWSFGISFHPFNPEAPTVKRFADKINSVMNQPPTYNKTKSKKK